MINYVATAKLFAHPNNPRIEPRQDVVDQIAAQITAAGRFDESHALIVRNFDGKFQIVSGHHRWIAAQQAGVDTVPCWIKDLTDEQAYMELVLCNTQSELHPLEEGKHAAESGMDLKAYAEQAGKKYTTLYDKVKAFRVLAVTHVRNEDARDSWRNLAEIHAAPHWLWSALVKQMIESGWTVQVTRDKTAAFKDIPDPPSWTDSSRIAAAIMDGQMRPSEVAKLQLLVDNAKVTGKFRGALIAAIESNAPSLLSEVQAIVAEWERHQADFDESERQEKLSKQRESESARQRVNKMRQNIALEEWKALSDAEREEIINPVPGEGGVFNKQDNESIEWAQWSWNPVTGCKHDCSYCLSGDTLILLADGRSVALKDLTVGEKIIGTKSAAGYRKFVETEVLAHWRSIKQAFEITLADGRKIISSGDHRFLTERGWKFVTPVEKPDQRPFLTTNNSLLGIGEMEVNPDITQEYMTGYLSGVIRGDGHLKTHKDHRRENGVYSQFRLAMKDQEATNRVASYLSHFGIEVQWFDFEINAKTGAKCKAIRTSTKKSFDEITALIDFSNDTDSVKSYIYSSEDYLKGFLAGIFDAEGSNTGNNQGSTLRIFNSDELILKTIEKGLEIGCFSFIYDVDKKPANKVVRTIRITGGLSEHVRFFQWCNPAIRRKLKLSGASIKNDLDLRVVSIIPLGIDVEMFDITTGTEDFIANGVVAHNCYARDIANSQRMKSVYPNGFIPTFRSNALNAPKNTKVPKEAETDARFKNVFTCSMADLFGRWVPIEWINAVMLAARGNSQWNFLFLTKFPQRLSEIEIPENAWMGTTVDLQARVANAEKAFANVKSKVKWLSVEPLIEPLQFSSLEMFDWVVIGGASASSKTPAWQPPYRWIDSLVRQCDDAKVPIYFKSNLGIANRIIELPFDAVVKQDPQEAPASFKYLGNKS